MNKNNILICRVVVIILFVVLLPNDFIDRFFYFINRPGGFLDKYIPAGMILAIWLITLFGVLAIPFTRFKSRLFLSLFIFINSVFYLSFHDINGFELSYLDFISLLSSISSAPIAIETYFPTIMKNILMVIPLILLLVYSPWPIKYNRRYLRVLPFLFIGLSIVGTSGIVFYKKTGHGTKAMPSFIVPSALAMTNIYDELSRDKNETDRIVPTPLDLPKINNIVVVMDESIRWDFIDLNFDRNITPSLLDLDNVINFGKSVSYSNCSQYTNILFRKAARYGRETQDLNSDVYIWDIAKLAGFKSFLMDQQQNGIGHDFFTKEERLKFNIIPSSHLSDVELAEQLVHELRKKSGNNFYLLMKKGAHFPYSNDGIDIKFKPNIGKQSFRKASKEQVINSYKNMVFHATGGFFNVIKKNQDIFKNTIIIYTSDHGQNFKNMFERATHCSTENPSEEEGEVPLFLLSESESKLDKNFFVERFLRSSRSKAHFDIIPIVMSLMGYDNASVQKFMETDILREKEKIGFVYGNVAGYFNGKPERKLIEQE